MATYLNKAFFERLKELFIRGNLALACVPLLGLFLLVNVLILMMQKNVHKTFRLRY